MATLTGTTKTPGGAPIAGAIVKLFRSSTDGLLLSTTSDANGVWSFAAPDEGPFYVSAYLDSPAFVAGTSRRDLVAIADAPPVDEEVPPGDGTTVKNLWTGVPTSDGVIVSARMNTTKTANLSRLVISTSADLSSPVKSAIVSPDATYRIAKMVATGLQSNTEYHYGVEIDGILDTATKGRFRTLPPANTAASFRLALGCCSNHLVGSASGYPAWQAIREMTPRPAAFLHIGDITYSDTSAADEATHLAKYESMLSSATGFATRHQTLREIPTAYMWDDHDFGPDNSTGMDKSGVPRAWRQGSLDAFRRRIPAPVQSSTADDTVDYAFVIGRVRVIMSDLRSSKWVIDGTTSDGDPANISTRTIMGTAQKQRWKDHITAAAAAGQVVVWCSSTPYVDGDWGDYVNDRTELADHIKASGMNGRVCVISGDMHAQALHTGIDYATGGGASLPVFNVGPLHNNSSHKGGPYTLGPFPASTGVSAHQYGIMDVTDDGANITVHWTGKNATDGSINLEHRFAIKGNIIAVPPSQMAAPSAVKGIRSAQITLAAPFNGGAAITGYTVVSSPAGGVDSAAGTTALSRTMTGLTEGVSYTFMSTATNPAGTSPASPASNAIIPDAPVVTKFEATGGTVTEPGDGYKYWTFLASDTLNVTQEGNVEYLIVAGGGGGSAHGTGRGGGGGCGGVRASALENGATIVIPVGAQAITVGAGGLGVASGSGKGTNGGNSSIAALIEAVGGGAGGFSTTAANAGGSGGGAGAGDTSAGPGAGTAGQGNTGGAAFPSTVSNDRSAGGGGAGGVGGAAPSALVGGNGGPGVTVWGRELGGGGGGSTNKSSSNGGVHGVGTHGGGNGGGSSGGLATSGAPNTGGGGGGATNTTASGAGGSGIVVIRRLV